MSTIAFITTCKSRLAHVQRTLPLLVGEAPDEVIFVDYGCPQGSGDWVQAHFPGVKVVRLDDDPGFNISRARNAGAAASTSDWFCFIDADVLVKPGWVAWLRKHLRPDAHWRASRLPSNRRDPETWGTFLCHRVVFERSGGYDDVFCGWGGEDADLYLRLRCAGVPEQNFPHEFLKPIRHDDALRVLHYELKDKRLNQALGSAYRDVKHKVSMACEPGQMPSRETREWIMKKLVDRLRRLDADPGLELPSFEVKVGSDRVLSPEFNLRARATISFEVVRAPKTDEQA